MTPHPLPDSFRNESRGLNPVIALFVLFGAVLVVGAVAATFVLDFGSGSDDAPEPPETAEFGCVDGRLLYTDGPRLQYVELQGVTGPADQFPWEPGDGAAIENRSALQVVWVGPGGNQSVTLFDGCG